MNLKRCCCPFVVAGSGLSGTWVFFCSRDKSLKCSWHSLLKTFVTENGLQLSNGRVRIAGKGVENNLVSGVPARRAIRISTTLCELVLCLVYCLFVWRFGFGVPGKSLER